MKKIVLGCAAVLLSLGLLAGCNNNPSTVDAVIISVDTNASVIVGETLELPYSVEPEKATVVAASDHEEYVTADAQDGILYLHGVTEGSAIVTLVGTYKKYAEANVNIDVSVVTEATEKTEPGTPDTGGGTPEKTDPVIGTVAEGDYWLGFTMSDVDYYFDGSLSGYYGSVTSDGWAAALVTVAAVTDGGYTLSFVDEEEATQYLYAYVASNGYVDLGIHEEPFTWQYDTAFETFVVELNDQWNFIGTYGTYVSLSMNDYGYLTGDTETSYAQYPAELFTPIEYNAPTTITINESVESIEQGETLQLTLTFTGTDPVNEKVIWESSEPDYVTVSSAGLVTANYPCDSVTIIVTSALDSNVKATVSFAVTAKAQGPVLADWQDTYGETDKTYKLAFMYSDGLRYFDETDAGGNYTYEGLTTSAFNAGSDISVAKGTEDNEYYLSFYYSDVEYWITIVNSNSHYNLSLSTTKASIFYNETYDCWGTSDGNYYLGAYYYQNGGEVYLYSQSISDVNDSSKLPARLYEWTGDAYSTYYEVADFDALSSTSYTGGSSNYTILTGTTYEGFTACNLVWPEYKASGNNTRVNSNHYIQFYNGDTMTLNLKASYTITRIEIPCTVGYSKTWSAAIDSGDASDEDITIAGDLVTITGTESASTSIVLKNTASAQARFRDIVIYYE